LNNYVTYHLHTELSLLDSTTNYKAYIDRAKELNQKAICFTEHGNIYNWVEKKLYCEKTQYVCNDCGEIINKDVAECTKCNSKNITQTIKPIKYMHGCEVYLTESLTEKIRDNYHTVLIAKNYDGFKELNSLIDLSTQEDHMYYKPRLTFNEFLNISDNVIKISACLQSPVNKLLNRIPELENEIKEKTDAYQKMIEDDKNEQFIDDIDMQFKNEIKEIENKIRNTSIYYEKIIKKYDYLEIQPHVNSKDQKDYNVKLLELSKAFDIPLIAGTDTHSINQYKAECRTMLQYGKNIIFDNEDSFDLTYKSFDELVNMFERQNSVPKDYYMGAINKTNIMADSVEEFKLDLTFKYPKLGGDEETNFKNLVNKMYLEKLNKGIIKKNPQYIENIKEEFRVLKKIGMLSFMQFMSELIIWCHENDIPTCPCRGSVGGSTIAYITDITDVDPIIWGTKFSRFANEDRLEIGDIDEDFAPKDREKVYKYIINRFGIDKTAYILTTNTLADKGAVDDIIRGFDNKYRKDNNLKKEDITPYSLEFAKEVKKAFEEDEKKAREKYKEIFYYFDGMKGTVDQKVFILLV
jgi:DNA polymerase-3 subunit alpha